jgi:ABC-type transport system substrate-binding protein
VELCLRSALAISIVSAALAAAAPVRAATPKDMLVMATPIDEFGTLGPGEVYELVPEEYVANTYDRLVQVDLHDPSRFNGDVAESWNISPDGMTITFSLRGGLIFHSGNPLGADDVAWSLQRAVLLDKGPAAVLNAIGLTRDNVAQRVLRIDERTVSVRADRKYAPTFLLNVLGSWPASILDKKLLLSQEKDKDFGNGWLRTHEAGSGAYKLVSWKANEMARYRARTHDIYIGQWSADYIDPHSNAQGFAWNPDNSDASIFKMLAWRNAWDIPQLTARTQAALAEPSVARRAQLYEAMQRDVLARSPFIIMFQKEAQVASRKGVSGLEVGAINDLVSYIDVRKR